MRTIMPLPPTRDSRAPTRTPMRPSAPTSAPAPVTAKRNMPMRGGPGGAPISLPPTSVMKKGGKVKKFAKGGDIDGCVQRGKTKGKIL